MTKKRKELSALGQEPTFTAPTTTAADDILKYCFFFCFFFYIYIYYFPKKTRLDTSCESSASQRIHMKYKSYSLQEIRIKKIKCRLLQSACRSKSKSN